YMLWLQTSIVAPPTCFFSASFFLSSRRRHTRSKRDWSSDVCSSDLPLLRIDFASHQDKTGAERRGGPGKDGEGAKRQRLLDDSVQSRTGRHRVCDRFDPGSGGNRARTA